MIKVYTTSDCRFCAAAKALLTNRGYEFKEVEIYLEPDGISQFQSAAPGAKTVPQITVGNILIGGFDDLQMKIDTPLFKKFVENSNG